MVKQITYNGVTYRRYDGRRYYEPGQSVLAAGGTSLHRQIWIDRHGAIPPGFDIHHKSHDTDHNAIENLEPLPGKEHARRHIQERLSAGGDLCVTLDAWRRSDDGKATLRSNARKMLARTPEREFTCAYCGVVARTRCPTKKHCSRVCQEAWGLAQRQKPCAICGALFGFKPHATKEVQTCSYQCGWALRRRHGLQPDGGTSAPVLC